MPQSQIAISEKFKGKIEANPQPDGYNLYWCNSIINVHYAGPLNAVEKAQLIKDIKMLATWPEDSVPDAFWSAHNAPKSIYMRYWILQNLYKNHPEIYADLVGEPSLQQYLLNSVDKVYALLHTDEKLSPIQEKTLLADLKDVLSMDADDPVFKTAKGFGNKDVLVDCALMNLRRGRPEVYDKLANSDLPPGAILLSEKKLATVDAARNTRQFIQTSETIKAIQTSIELNKAEQQRKLTATKLPQLVSQFDKQIQDLIKQPTVPNVMQLLASWQQLDQVLPASQRDWTIDRLKQEYKDLQPRIGSQHMPPGPEIPHSNQPKFGSLSGSYTSNSDGSSKPTTTPKNHLT